MQNFDDGVKSVLNFNLIIMEANQKTLIDENDFREELEKLSPVVKEVMRLGFESREFILWVSKLAFRKAIEKISSFGVLEKEN